jgi:MFS family permease
MEQPLSTTVVPWHRQVPDIGWRALWAAGIGWFCEVYEVFILSLTLPAFIVFFHLTTTQAGTIGSIEAGGLIVGGIISGWLADRIGRVKALFWSVFFYSIFTGLTAAVSTVGLVMALRFLAGLGMGGEWAAGAALVAETWPAAHRGKGGSLMQMGLPLGSLLAIGATALVTTLTGGLDAGGWRWLYVIGILPALLLLYIARRTPESPVWQSQQATRHSPTQSVAAAEPLFAGANFRRVLLSWGFVFFAQYVYWAVFTWAPTFLITAKHFAFLHSLTFILAQQLGSLVGFIVFAALVDRVGRKGTFILYLVVGALAMLLFTYGSSEGFLLLASVFTGFGITGIFAGLGPWAAEMVPRTESRGLAMGIAYNGGRLGGLIAPYLVGALATSVGGFEVGMLTTVIALACAIVVMLLSPETKGVTLA